MIRQFTLTTLALISTLLLFHWFAIDLWLQDFFYNADLQQWILDRDQTIPKLILYNGAKVIFAISVLALAIATLVLRKHRLIILYKQGIMIVLLSCLLVPLVAAELKAVTNTPCPKNVAPYNGHDPYVGILDTYPANFVQAEKARCFPAAHASGGFALLSLFFLFKTRKNKIIAIATALTIGWSTGLYKMLIGDHFLSHTIVAMLLAWLIILIIAGTIYSNKFFLSRRTSANE